MLVLAVDTTTRFGSTALVNGGELIAEVNYASPSSHSRQVFLAVDEVMRVAGKRFVELEGLAVAAGPGSFTGIRIGLSLVKALSLASGKPVAAVSALEALAQKLILAGVEIIVPMIDARKGEIFACAYRSSGAELQELICPAAYNPETFLELLPPDKVLHLIGTGVGAYWPLISDKLGPRAVVAGRSNHIAAEIGLLGEKYLEKGLGIKPSDLQPVYYRKSQAEEKKPVQTE